METRTRKTGAGRMRTLVGAAMVAGMAVGALGVASPAQAAETSKNTVWVNLNPSAKVANGKLHYVDSGDRFILTDMKADGYGVKAFIERGGKLVKTHYHGGGAETKVEFGYDLVSGYKYAMKVCAVDGPAQKVIGCSNNLGLTE